MLDREACGKAVGAALAVALACAPAAAAAGPDSEVASAFDRDDRFDLHFSLDYRYSSRSAAVKRELAGRPGADPDGPTPIVKDLVVSAARHELVPRLEIGVVTDVAITAEMPLVLRDVRQLDFDQRAGACAFRPDPGGSSCIDASNSTTVADELVPAGGFDGEDGGATGGDVLFRGTDRSGLDQIHLGLVGAPFNQARDPSKPTWKLGAELRLSIGEVMRFDRARPGQADGVSRGVHELRLYTSMARRIGWAEPFFEGWWMTPIATRADAPLEGGEREFGGQLSGAQQRAGGRFGLEAIVWQSADQLERIGVQLGGEVEALFAGRAYTDMWEVFAYAGAQPTEPLGLDADPLLPGVQPLAHPGVSNVQEYMTLAGQAAIDAHLARWIRVDLGVRFGWEQSHLISTADLGQDSIGDDNDVVDPGTDEVNPLHAPVIDAVGHRYRIDDVFTYTVSAGVRVLF